MARDELMISLENLLYQRNQNQENEKKVVETRQQKSSYKEILEKIQQLITARHSTELAETLNKADAKPKLLNLIAKYLNSEKLVDDQQSISELANRIYEDMAGLAFLKKYLADEDVEEINVNGATGTWVQYKGKKVLLQEQFNSVEECKSIVQKMAHMGKIILDGTKPFGDSYISKGIRMSGAIAPCVDEDFGAICSIRKQKKSSITKESLVSSGTVTEEQLEFITMCVNSGIPVAFAGSTGSGKTSNMGYILGTIEDETRIVTIEDTKELNLPRFDQAGYQVNDVIQLYTREEPNLITMQDLLKLSLRLHPDILVPAEMRAEEAMTAQEAGRTGHIIISSLHANGALDAYDRILTMCLQSGTTLSEERLLKNIVKSFPIIVFCKQLKDKSRRWMDIYEGTGVKDGEVVGQSIFKFEVKKSDKDANGKVTKVHGKHKRVGCISSALAETLRINSVDDELIEKYTNGVKECMG